MKRKIKGPCWLTISDFTPPDAPRTYCAYEICIEGHKEVEVMKDAPEPPPLAVPADSSKMYRHWKLHCNVQIKT